jgi:hypothetical protein
MALNLEELSNAVSQYPCLYDKSKPSYHDKNVKRNAWVAVAKEIGLEGNKDGANAVEKAFVNLRANYTKKKRALKLATRSGSGAPGANEARRKLDKFQWLSWVDDYTGMRKGKSNVGKKEGLESRKVELQRELEARKNEREKQLKRLCPGASDNSAESGSESDKEEEEEEEEEEDDVVADSQSSQASTPAQATPPSSASSSTPARMAATTPKWTKKSEQKKADERSKILKRIEAISNQEEGDVNHHYGVYISKEISKLPERYQHQVKNQISNVLFQAQQASTSQQPPQTVVQASPYAQLLESTSDTWQFPNCANLLSS